MLLQIGLVDNLASNPIITIVIFYLPFIGLMLYGQKFQSWMILTEVARSLNRMKAMKERGRQEMIDYVNQVAKPATDPSERLDQMLEHFTILPVDLDPSGIVKKMEHILTVRDERVKAETKRLAPIDDPVKMSAAENIMEVATVLNLMYKIIRHFYLLGKRNGSLYVVIQLQMIMPILLQEADALINALNALKKVQPLGDGVGAMVAGKLMLEKEKKIIAKDTVLAETEYHGRQLYLIKAEGPGGMVGRPGEAVEKLVTEVSKPINAIFMIDAALKLEGETTGDIAEGIGAAIGGIGVDRFRIEEVASGHNIPLYAIVVKESLIEAISVMKKEIAETADKVLVIVDKLIEERTNKGDRVLLVGVGNTLGIGQ